MESKLMSGGGFLLSEGGFNPLQIGDWALFFWTALVFVLLLIVLSRFLWGPLMQTVGRREEQIRDDLAKAEEARQQAEEVREKHRLELEAAAQEAKGLLDETHRRGEVLRAELESTARQEAEQILQKARRQIEADKHAALQEIRDQVVDLSVEISKAISERAVDREDHLRMAEQLIPKVRDLS